MDVRDLATALVAIADLFNAANREINGDLAELRVEVSASFKAGSFGIDLADHLGCKTDGGVPHYESH